MSSPGGEETGEGGLKTNFQQMQRIVIVLIHTVFVNKLVAIFLTNFSFNFSGNTTLTR